MEDWLASSSLFDSGTNDDRTAVLCRSALKSAAAGTAGAVLTNPLDVIRNEMFKTNLGLTAAVRHLRDETGGYGFVARGLGKNMIAVAVPVACTIFFVDALVQYTQQQRGDHEQRH